MYGVPANLNLSRLTGAALIQLAIGEFQIQFHFHPEGTISVEGHWELRGADGVLIDQAMDRNSDRAAYRVHVVLGSTVTSFRIDAPRSFSLTFDSGHVLTIFDDSEHYESFSIQPGDVFV